MRPHLIAVTAAFGLVLLTGPALSQEKTASACIKEWRAAKADFQKKGITEKAYVETCRGGAETAQTNPNKAKTSKAPEDNRTAAAPAGGMKTATACRDEWRADKAGFQAKGVTEKSYVAQCRSNPSTSTGNDRANNSPSADKPSTSRSTDVSRPRETSGARSVPSASNVGQFQREADAKARCNGDTVVWANLNSKIYHFAGKKAYGTTKNGAFMCEREAMTQGMRASKSEDRPGS